MTDYQQFQDGYVVYPATNPHSLSNLQVLNPPLFWALDFFANVIQIHLGTMWNAAVVEAGLPALVNNIVQYSLPYNPMPGMQQQQVKFPLLAVYEWKTHFEFKTLVYEHEESIWKVAYILPALTEGQKEVLQPFLKGVRDVLVYKAIYGHDPGYQDDLQIWDTSVSGIEKVRVTDAIMSDLPPSDPKTNLCFPTLLLDLHVWIRQDSQASWFENLSGVDMTQGLDGYVFSRDSINNI